MRPRAPSSFPRTPNARRRLAWLGVLSLTAGVLASVAAAQRMAVDIIYMHLTGRGIAHGFPIYDLVWQRMALNELYHVDPHPLGIMYPPNTGFFTLPLSFLTVRTAQIVWFLVLLFATVLGSRSVIRFAGNEKWRDQWPILVGLILLSACMRWGFTPLQCAPLVFGLLCLAVVGLHTRRDVWSFVATCLVLNLKITLAPPFLGLIWLHRRFKLLGAALGSWVLLTAAAFARVGGWSAVVDYRANVSAMEAIADINTPDPWFPHSIARLDWIYLFYGLSRNLVLARFAAALLTLVTALFIAREFLRLRTPPDLGTTTAFLAPLVYLTLLCVYHHHYDSSLVLVPVLLLGLLTPKSLTRTSVGLALPLVVLITLVPVATTQHLIVRLFGESKMGVLNLLFPITTSLALVGSIIMLRDTVNKQRGPQRRSSE